jgi:hypothetical protein
MIEAFLSTVNLTRYPLNPARGFGLLRAGLVVTMAQQRRLVTWLIKGMVRKDLAMGESTCYERFPGPIVLLANLVGLSIYAVGTYLLWQLGVWWGVLYVLYCGWMEWRLLTKSCVNCYYYGKVCGFGKGKLCAVFFKQGDPERFGEKPFSWRDLIPDMGVLVFPVVGSVILLIRDFSWVTVTLLVVLIVLGFAGNAVVRGSFACKYCKQREIGCPAEKLFGGQAEA